MKNLIAIIFLICSSNAMTQYCRAVHSIDDTGAANNRGTVITELNGEMFFATVSASVEDTLKITVANIDYRGETSNYSTTILSSIPGERYALSGVATSGDDMVLVLLAEGATSTSLNYIRYNTLSASITEMNTMPTIFNRSYVRSRQKGDSVVTYIAHSSGTSRISTNLNGTFSPVSADYTNVMMYGSGSMSVGRKRSELLITASGIEYIAINSTIVKRSVTGVYSELLLPSGLSLNGFTMDLNDQGELVVLSGQDYYKFNTSFAVIDQGQLSLSTGAPTRFSELFYENGNWLLFYHASAPNTSTKAVFDNNMNIISEFPLNGGTVSPYDKFKTQNGRYIVGHQLHIIQRESVAIINDVDLLSPGKFYEYSQEIDHHKLHMHTGHLGVLFQNEADFLETGFLMEHEGIDKSVLFQSSNTFLGKDASGDTVGMLPYYNIVTGIYPGPFTSLQNRSFESMDKYNRGLYVDKAMIDNHIVQITNSTPGYEMPLGILNWPAHGDVTIGQAQNIAPFYDQNSNGIYEPELGDYPSIYGNRCVLNIFHQGEEAAFASSPDLNMECLQYIYVYECDSNEALMNTVFVNQSFKIYNSAIDSVFVGPFMDTDIGNYADDYCGTFVDLGMMYAYNADLYDEDYSGFASGIGFHEHPPASGALFLRGARAEPDGIDNPAGIASDESVNGFGFGDLIVDNEYYGLTSSFTEWTNFIIAGPTEFYNWLQGKDASGNYTQVNGVDVRHGFFGYSDPQFYAAWGQNHGNNYSESIAGNPGGDRIVYGGTGPFSLNSSDPSTNSMEFLVAYIVAIDSILLPTNPMGDPVQKLYKFGQNIKEIYSSSPPACGTLFDFYVSPATLGIEELVIDIAIYPNPSINGKFTVRCSNEIREIIVFDMLGREITLPINLLAGEIDGSSLKDGNYIVKMLVNNSVITKKIVVVR